MIVVCCPHRSDDRNIIDARANVRKPVTHGCTALPIPFETDLQRIEFVALLAVRIVDHQECLAQVCYNEIVGGFKFERSDLHITEELKMKIVENCKKDVFVFCHLGKEYLFLMLL